ncbi:arylsulfatase [Seonamhaeicola aphaedonensis]|uniref:Arylsulfatase A-like enzyme n=1 Tax=Seonamhaeicola aphaedonensis TaxID=1461338 RepID=A0A3D9HEB6_9FLAO|nr:arylsulfatase [Seonamhaeicola aphaedonensis]RED47814.1 arylsulfatase A-like enzyme [Seonamhaeicola aphaedonensis]
MKLKLIILNILCMVLILGTISCKIKQVDVEKEVASKPNIIFILADDLGYGDVGFNGQDKIKTPNIDKLAANGMVFTNHYTGSTVCGPSRAVLMTGKHTGHATVRGNPRWTASGNPVDINAEDVTVAEELKRAGYTTGIIGKWGLAENLGDGLPNKQGFDYFYGFNQHSPAHHYYPKTIFENENELTIEGNDPQTKEGQHIHYLITEKATEFIDKNHKAPFFLYLSYTIPHFELTILEKEKEQYKNLGWPKRKMTPGHYRHDEDGHITYAAMVSTMDRDIGNLLKQLESLGLADNTLIVFTSDNGHEYDDLQNEFFNSNGDFKGHKRDLYEGGIRTPFVAYWPNKIKAGSKTNHISAFWDFLPTACELAGIRPSDKIDGISYAPTLLGNDNQQEKHNYLYWEFNERQGPIQAVRKDNWKAVKFDKKPVELYDLNQDISEQINVAEQYPEKAQELLHFINNSRTEHPEFPLVKKTLKKK